MIGIWCTISYSSEILACHSLGNSEYWMTSTFTRWAVKAYYVSTPLQNITWSLIHLIYGHSIWCFWVRYHIFFSHSKAVQVTKAMAWSLHPQRVSVCGNRTWGRDMGAHMHGVSDRVLWGCLVLSHLLVPQGNMYPIASSNQQKLVESSARGQLKVMFLY